MNKTLLAIFIAATAAAQATSYNYVWGEDSADAFNLTIAGNGVPHSESLWKVITAPLNIGTHLYSQGHHHIFREVFTSPSGFWQVLAEFEVGNHFGAGLGDHYHLYTDSIAIFSGRDVITPASSVIFSSQPDLRDAETWTWAMNIFAHDVNQVPEDGSMILGFLTLLVLPLFYEKLRPLRQRQ